MEYSNVDLVDCEIRHYVGSFIRLSFYMSTVNAKDVFVVER